MLAKDEKTGKVEAQEVTATVHHPAATLVTVTFAGAGGKTQAIVCTPEHPFFVDGKGWVEAGSLGIGTSIVTRAGPTLAVKSLDWKRSAQAKPGLAPGLTTPAFTVYNFTVDQDHTFFVGTANGGAWTHNSGCDLVPRMGTGTPVFDTARDILKGKLPLHALSAEDRELAAQHYATIGFNAGKANAPLVRAYNFARAAVMRGQRPSVPNTAIEFGTELSGR